MTVSAVIPTYNGARTIRATIESVLRQTSAPSEVLVLDDGSSDDTVAILRSYGSQLTLLQQRNQGVANARNVLCAKARGDLIAFLDHDDLWHPRYLEIQQRHYQAHPELVGLIANHVDFYGYGEHQWPEPPPTHAPLEVIDPLAFLRRYNADTGPFASASFLCVPKATLSKIGEEPFKLSGVDDSYLCTWLPLLGPVGYTAVPLGAYRVTEAAQSTDKLKAYGLWVQMFELMARPYEQRAPAATRRVFRSAFASKRRQYARRLLGAGRDREARRQLRHALADAREPVSVAKSVGLLAASYLPGRFQPEWPAADRDWQEPGAVAGP